MMKRKENQLDLKGLLKFVDFTHKFQQIKRVLYATGENRLEDDADHSFQLALICWYLIGVQKLKLNIDKVIQYALVHDLVEVYAGDTFFYSTDQKLKASKEKRERKALQTIGKKFSEFKELYSIIEQYEARGDSESKFVYSIDKIVPVLNIYLDKGRTWKKFKISYQMIRSKDEKVAVSKFGLGVWQEVIKLLNKNRDFFHEVK